MDGSLEAQPLRPWQEWLDRLLVSRGRGSAIRAVVEIGAGLALCFGLSWSLGGGKLVSSAWYLPMILIAAGRFRYMGAVLTAVVATALAGPVLHIATGSTERPSLWVGRGIVFLLVGLVTASLIEQLVAGKEREIRLAEQERDLAVRQAAVIATVSHEFRTPLTVITGVARTLETHGMVSAEGVPLLEGLAGATRRLTDLVNAVGAVMDDTSSGAFVRSETVVIRDVLTRVLLTLGVRDPEEPSLIRGRSRGRALHIRYRTHHSALASHRGERGQVLATRPTRAGAPGSERRTAMRHRARSRAGDR